MTAETLRVVETTLVAGETVVVETAQTALVAANTARVVETALTGGY